MPDYDRHVDIYDAWSTAASPYRTIEAFGFMEVVGPVHGLDILDLWYLDHPPCTVLSARKPERA